MQALGDNASATTAMTPVQQGVIDASKNSDKDTRATRAMTLAKTRATMPVQRPRRQCNKGNDTSVTPVKMLA